MTLEEQYLKKGGELEPGESVLKHASTYYQWYSSGHLYLTTRKLMWIPYRFHLPMLGPPERFAIPLVDIESVSVNNALVFIRSRYG
jgi:hypothetical protein